MQLRVTMQISILNHFFLPLAASLSWPIEKANAIKAPKSKIYICGRKQSIPVEFTIIFNLQ